MKKEFLFIVILFLITGCKSKNDSIKVGAILPLTGNFAYFGNPEYDILKMEVDSINILGGINGKKIELIVEDSKSNTKDGVTAAQKIILNKPNVVISSMTSVSLAVQSYFTKNNIPQIALSCHSNIVNVNTFRPYYGFDDEMYVISQYLKATGIKKLAALWINVPECKDAIKNILKPLLDKENIELVLSESYNFGNNDYKNLVAKIKSKNPDKILVLDFGDQLQNILIAFEQQNIRNKVIGNIGFFSASYIEPHLLENIVITGPAFLISDSKYNIFNKDFIRKTGQRASYDVVYTKDAINFIFKALQNDTNNSNLLNSLKSIKELEGLSGKLRMKNDGNLKVDISLGIYKNGKLELYKE